MLVLVYLARVVTVAVPFTVEVGSDCDGVGEVYGSFSSNCVMATVKW